MNASDPLRSQLHPEFYGNPVIYGTGGETSNESGASRDVTLPRTSYDLLDQNLPVAELTAAQTRRCRTLKKQMQMFCAVIDMNMHFVERTLTRRGGLGIFRLCGKAITDSLQSLQKASDEFTDILRDWKEASGNGDDNTYGSKPSRENQSESGTLDGPPHRRDDRQSLPPSRREGPPPGLFDDRPSLSPSRREGPPPGFLDDRPSLSPSRREGPMPEHFDDCQSLPPSRPGHFEINDGHGDTPVRPNAELPSSEVCTNDERDETEEEDETEGKEPPAGVDDSHDDKNIDVPPAGRAKLGPRTLIERDCGRDEADRCERQYVRDVKQQESGKELDDLTVLRYQSSRHHRSARGRRR